MLEAPDCYQVSAYSEVALLDPPLRDSLHHVDAVRGMP